LTQQTVILGKTIYILYQIQPAFAHNSISELIFSILIEMLIQNQLIRCIYKKNNGQCNHWIWIFTHDTALQQPFVQALILRKYPKFSTHTNHLSSFLRWL